MYSQHWCIKPAQARHTLLLHKFSIVYFLFTEQCPHNQLRTTSEASPGTQKQSKSLLLDVNLDAFHQNSTNSSSKSIPSIKATHSYASTVQTTVYKSLFLESSCSQRWLVTTLNIHSRALTMMKTSIRQKKHSDMCRRKTVFCMSQLLHYTNDRCHLFGRFVWVWVVPMQVKKRIGFGRRGLCIC